jgi:hypothetical protein
MAKEDRTEIGITGKKIPKPGSAKKQYELEKKRRMKKHLGQNVGGTQYSSDVNPYLNPRSVREEVLVDYLLDEGFASDEKSAEAIANSMSEAWIESIIEGYVELNRKRQNRMTDQSMRHMNKGSDDDWEKAYKIENERDTQTPEVSKSKSAENRVRGEKKRRG